MYFPSIGPRDPHRLWSSHPDTFSHTIRPRDSKKSPATGRTNNDGGTTAAGSLSGSNPLFALERDEEFRSNHYHSIRTFGYDYLKPPGLGKALRTLMDAAAHDEDQSEIMVNNEQVDDGNFDGNETIADGIMTNDDTGNLPALPDFNDDTQFTREFSSDNEEVNNEELIAERNLDDEIPSADEEDYNYGDDYNDNEYDDGFMAQEEEYEDHEGNITLISDDRSFIQTPISQSYNQGQSQEHTGGNSVIYSQHRRDRSGQLQVPPLSSPYPRNLETPVPIRTRRTSAVIHGATPTRDISTRPTTTSIHTRRHTLSFAITDNPDDSVHNDTSNLSAFSLSMSMSQDISLNNGYHQFNGSLSPNFLPSTGLGESNRTRIDNDDSIL